MRGADPYYEALFTTFKLEDLVPSNHPLRTIRTRVNDAQAKMDAKFSAMYDADIKGGRPRIAPEELMRAMLLQVLYRVRSEPQLVEQIQYNLLFRWFISLAIEDAVWNHSIFSQWAPNGTLAQYEPHRPAQPPQYRLVQQHAATFFA